MTVAVQWCFESTLGILDVQCQYQPLSAATGRVVCQCHSFSGITTGYEDLAETIYSFVTSNFYNNNLAFSSVALNNCKSLKITVDFR